MVHLISMRLLSVHLLEDRGYLGCIADFEEASAPIEDY